MSLDVCNCNVYAVRMHLKKKYSDTSLPDSGRCTVKVNKGVERCESRLNSGIANRLGAFEIVFCRLFLYFCCNLASEIAAD